MAKKKVLVVEDEEDILELLQTIGSHLGMAVDVAPHAVDLRGTAGKAIGDATDLRFYRAQYDANVLEVDTAIGGFVDELPRGRHLLFVHGGVIRILTQDLGVDRFVPTGSVVGVDWTHRRLLFVRESVTRAI